MSRSRIESDFEWQLFALGYRPRSDENPDGFEREFKFHPSRKWRLDFAWPTQKVAVECDGIKIPGKAHTGYYGIKRDIEKGNALTSMGWRLLRISHIEISSGQGIRMLEALLEQ